MPTQTFQAAADSPASIADAWSGLQRAETWEGVAGVDDVTGATHGSDGQLTGFGFAATVSGLRYPGQATIASANRPDQMRLELTTSEMTATIEVALTPAGERTRVLVDLTVTSRSFLAGMFFPSIAAAIGRGLPSAVEDFANRLDSDRNLD
jgi:carbon monoxide dehydrogenase subunit G